jgi:hypothetical protein
MIAEVKGIFRTISGSSPLRYLVRGVLKSTFSGTHSSVDRLGKRRYSLKVLDGSFTMVAILKTLLALFTLFLRS